MFGKRLLYADTIGVMAPGSPEPEHSICEHIKIWQDIGFKIKTSKHIYSKRGFLAGDDSSRANDLMDMFIDESISCIIALRGGYGSMRILPFLNFDIISKNPKIFIGYSDITPLLNYLNKKLGLITFHGPMLTSDIKNPYTFYSFIQSLMYGFNPYTISNPFGIPLYFKNFNSTLTGKVIGGNLSLICSTLGTKYEVDFYDNILFLEEVNEAPYKIDRMLTQLLLSNKLQTCRGFILGQFSNCIKGNEPNSSVLRVIHDRLLSLNKPTVLNFMSGHDYPKLTLPIGATVSIDPASNCINILENVVL